MFFTFWGVSMIKFSSLKFTALCIALIMVLSFCGCRKNNLNNTSSSLSLSTYDIDNNNFPSYNIETSDNEETKNSNELENSEKINSDISNKTNVENDNYNSVNINTDDNSDDYNFDFRGYKVKIPSPSDYHTPAITNVEDRYATLQLDTLTTYYGYTGFFHLNGMDILSVDFVAEKLGVVAPGYSERVKNATAGVEPFIDTNAPYGYQSEFYDKDGESLVYFYALGFNNAYELFYDYVLEVNEGWGTIPVHVKENDDLIKSIKNIKLYELTEFHGIKGYFSENDTTNTPDEINLKLLGTIDHNKHGYVVTKYKGVRYTDSHYIYFNYYDENHIQIDTSSDNEEWVYIIK